MHNDLVRSWKSNWCRRLSSQKL